MGMIAERRARFSSLHPDTKAALQLLEKRYEHKRRMQGIAFDRLDDPRRRRGRRAGAIASALVGYGQAHFGTGQYGGGGS